MTRIDAARAVLAANDRGGYTVPTDRLYPFQWNWDSAFVAMGFATYDTARALTELERLIDGQWPDGMIPHIVFHAPADSYFPGPEVWGTNRTPATSGITQPPVFALALAWIAERGGDPTRIARLYQAAVRHHRWWRTARDPDGTGLVALLHPWESGRDNSPMWDAPLARVPETTVTPIRRRDTGHVDQSMRPSDQDYRRYIHLVDVGRAGGWDPATLWRTMPFRMVEPGVNAILLAADEALAGLADRYGTAADRAEISGWISRGTAALSTLWSPELGLYRAHDTLTNTGVAVPSSAGLLPLLTAAPGPSEVTALAATLRRWHAAGQILVPSTPREVSGFDARRYWRGPVWAVVNWLIARGLARHGETELAELVRADTARLLERAGFAEYFDPLTGDGLGGDAFTWTAAVQLLLAA